MSHVSPPIVDIRAPYAPLLTAAGLTDYESIMQSSQGEALIKPGLGQRERIRLELADPAGGSQTVYLKRYGTNKPAEIEWAAVQAVTEAGVPTMKPMAMGVGPAGGFIIVSAVPGDALSRRLADLQAQFGDAPIVGDDLAKRLGAFAAKLHSAGLTHRDFYADHIFVDEKLGQLDLYLIDLARVFRPRWRRWRWWLKDLAQLKYSLPTDWRERHWPTLLAAYTADRHRSLPAWGERIIDFRVRRMTARTRRKQAGSGGEA